MTVEPLRGGAPPATAADLLCAYLANVSDPAIARPCSPTTPSGPRLREILPAGDLLTGSGGTIVWLSQAGEVSTLPFNGFEVRGLAF